MIYRATFFKMLLIVRYILPKLSFILKDKDSCLKKNERLKNCVQLLVEINLRDV